MNNKLINILKQKIDKGDLKTKEEIIGYVKNLKNTLYQNPELMQLFKEMGIDIDSQDLNKITTELLNYFDTKSTNLNLDGVTQMTIKDEKGFDDKYIKIQNADGSFTVLEDNLTEKDFVTQFKERQNRMTDIEKEGDKNKEQIINDMKKDKIEVSLESSSNINTRELTPEERREFAAVLKKNNADEINFIVDVKRNIYINRDTGETYYTYRNNEGKMEVRRVDEQTSQTLKKEVNTIDEFGNEKKDLIETPNELDLDHLDDFEIEYMLNNRFDSLTPGQKQALIALAERRKEMTSTIDNKEKQKEQSHQYVKKLEFNKPYNGYTSVLILGLITAVFGVLFVINIIK